MTDESLCDAGLWRYARHPNHFGEQAWWWGVALLAEPWTLIGPLFNTVCMVRALQGCMHLQ